MTTQLDKTFDPAQIEAKWYRHWEDNGLFRPERPDAQPFTLDQELQPAAGWTILGLHEDDANGAETSPAPEGS